MLTFYIQKVKGQLHSDIIMFCKNTYLAFIQHHNLGTGGEIVTIFHIFSDTELVTLILGAQLETVVIVFCAAGLKMCVKHPCFRICSFFAETSISKASSAVMVTTLFYQNQACEHIQGKYT